MGLADYLSRNPHGTSKPISMYDEDFVIAQIDIIIQNINGIKQRGRPGKAGKMEPPNNSEAPNTKPVTKSHRGRP